MLVEKEGKDGALAAYLGVTIESQGDGSLVLKQEGLIGRIIEATGMQGANPKKTLLLKSLSVIRMLNLLTTPIICGASSGCSTT